MTNIVDTTERDALSLLLRSKTALGRLVDSEVHGVLDFLESIGYRAADPTPVAPAAIELVPPPVVDPAPIAPPPAQ